jgi:hypothetical protein
MSMQSLPEQCVHVERGELPHLRTIEITTVDDAPADYRYATGTGRMRLCALCTGRVHGVLLTGIPIRVTRVSL